MRFPNVGKYIFSGNVRRPMIPESLEMYRYPRLESCLPPCQTLQSYAFILCSQLFSGPAGQQTELNTFRNSIQRHPNTSKRIGNNCNGFATSGRPETSGRDPTKLNHGIRYKHVPCGLAALISPRAREGADQPPPPRGSSSPHHHREGADQPTPNGSRLMRLMNHASWMTQHGPRRMDHASWIPPQGSRLMDHAAWITPHGSRRMNHAAWTRLIREGADHPPPPRES